MNRLIKTLVKIFLGPGLAVILPAFALADSYYTAVIDGPSAGTPSPATGTAIFTLNSDETEVAYVIEYTELVGTETVAHIHNAPPGVVGPVFHDLPYGSPKIGVWEVDAFEVAELKAGRVNILIHSEAYPGGEIRGDVFFDSVAGVAEPGSVTAAAGLVLRDNYPNPFNPRTTIEYRIPRSGRVRLAIHDVRGRLVATLVDEVLSSGEYRVVWDGRDGAGTPVAAGAYFLRLSAAHQVEMKTISLIK